jgi:ABC-type transporter MlaC component
MNRTFRSILALTCIFAASMQSLAVEATNALAVSVDKVFAILGDPEMKGDEKKAEKHSKIRAVLGEGFDYEEISKRALGKQVCRRLRGIAGEHLHVRIREVLHRGSQIRIRTRTWKGKIHRRN